MKKPLTILLGLAVATLTANAAAAQSSSASVSPPPASEQGLKIPMIVWAAGVAADQVATYRFSSQYQGVLHEENVLIRGLDRHPTLLVTAGSAIDAASGWAVYHFVGPRHPRLARVAFYGAAVYRAWLSAYDLQMMRRAQQMRLTAGTTSAF
jgi:hypothetical protein